MMKKILLLNLSLITLNSCDFPDPIPVEGCTDPNAINYNSNADTDNNSCDFTADILFYLNQDKEYSYIIKGKQNNFSY